MADNNNSQGDYPSAFSFYFSVAILDGGKSGIDAAFRDVTGLSAEMETETYMEGGGNTTAYHLPKGLKYQNLVLTRGMAPSTSKLVRWCQRTLEGGLSLPIETKSLKVSLLGPNEQTLHAWSFAGAYPVKWEAEGFNSMKSEIAIEKIELAFSSLKRES